MDIKTIIFAMFLSMVSMAYCQFYDPHARTYKWCCAVGDPHYFHFDGGVTHFQGDCRYLLAGTCACTDFGPDCLFHVYVENRRWVPWWPVTFTKLVDTVLYGYTFRFEEFWQFKVWDPNNNQIVGAVLGQSFGSVNTFSFGWWCMGLEDTVSGLMVLYCYNHVACVRINDCKYSNKTCGLCGNNDGIPNVEYSTPPEFWQVAPVSTSTLPQSCYTPPSLSGSGRKKRRTAPEISVPNDSPCNLLLNFRCDGVEALIESCAFDVQAMAGVKGAHCLIMETFIAQCQAAHGWREQADCPCPDGSYEDECPRCENCKTTAEKIIEEGEKGNPDTAPSKG